MATRGLGRTAKSDIPTVHSTPNFATQWLMPRLARFSALAPDIDASYPPPADLLLQGVDIDIRYGMKRLQPAGTMVLPFPAETIVPFCAPSLADGAQRSRAPGGYTFNLLKSPAELPKIRSFQDWLFSELEGHSPSDRRVRA